jgi:hypothetical protein
MKPSSFSQKLWRFCGDPRVTGPDLIDPMLQLIHDELHLRPGVLLAVHDWSTLSFGSHKSKADRLQLTHDSDVGYDLNTVLMVRGDNGASLAPAQVSMATANGVLSTRDEPPVANLPHIDQIAPDMDFVRGLKFNAAVVHVIDREADSISHWRRWSAEGHLALVRGDDRHVLCDGEETTLVTIATRLRNEGAFKDVEAARYHGRPARLHVAEVEIVLHRPGTRNIGKKKKVVPGPPLPLRLVVAELRDLNGKVLARWLLLSNVPAKMADAATIARWYYFRWRIESFHKLLKSGGWQLESWLQSDGKRLFNKMLLAISACVSIWALERRDDAESKAFQQLLMQLSGRQTKRTRTVTTSGLLAGLWVLQCSRDLLSRHGPEELNTMLEKQLPVFAN